MKLRPSVMLPFAAALLLGGLFVVLLVVQWQNLHSRSAGPAAAGLEKSEKRLPVQRVSVGDAPIPYGDPLDPKKYEKPRREKVAARGKLFRWNLAELPEGWDPAVAETLHNYFEAMEYDGDLSLDNSLDNAAAERIERARNELETYLASLGPEAVPTLGAILGVEGDFVCRRFLLYALGDLGPQSEQATWVLRDFFMERKEDPASRSEANHVLRAMARLGNQSSFEVLSQLAGEGGKVRSYRHEIISALGDHPRRQEAVPLFSRILLDDKSFDARNKSAQALGKIADMRTLGDLYAAYERERIWYAKQTILGSIGKIGNPNSIPFLEAQARGAPEDGVRLSAAKALHRIGTPYALDVLRSIARSEANEMVRENVAKWLKSSS